MKVLVRKADRVALYAGAEIIVGKKVIQVGKALESYRVFNIDPATVEIVDVPDPDMPVDFAPELYAWTGAALTPTERKVEQDAEKEADERAEAKAREKASLADQAPEMLAAWVNARKGDPEIPRAVVDWAAAYAKEKTALGH